MSRTKALGEAVPLKDDLLNMPYDALRAALRGHRPKGVKEAILGEMRRREALSREAADRGEATEEGRESLSYNSEAFSADGGMNDEVP